MIRSQIFVSLLLCIFCNSYGQQSLNFSFDHIDSKDGLTSLYNDFIYKDSRGFVWIGALDGVYRFDGLKIRKYPHGNKELNGIKGKYIQSPFFEDKESNFWFSTFEWINCYNRKQDNFSAFKLINEQGDTIQEGYSLFYLENDSLLWLRAGQQIFTYNINSQQQQYVTRSKGVRFDVETRANGEVKTIYACLWDGGSGAEVIHLTPNKSVEKERLWEKGIPQTNKEYIEVTKVIIQDSDNIWFFSDQGLFEFQPSNQQIRFVDLNDTKDKVVDGLFLDDESLLLVTLYSGIWNFDTQQFVFQENYTQNKNGKLTSNDIRGVYKDYQNHIWLSSNTGAGIDQSWLYNNKFNKPLPLKEGLELSVTSIVEDKEGRIWVSTKNDGIYIFDSKRDSIKHINYDTDYGLKNSFNSIHHLSTDAEGKVYALNNSHIFQLDIKNLKHHIIFDADTLKIHDLIHISLLDKVNLTDQGGFSFNLETEEVLHQEKSIKTGETQSFQLFEGKSNFYFPKKGDELLVYRKDIDSIRQVNSFKIKFDVYSIWEDETRDRIWIGSTDGLFSLNNGENSFENTFTEKDQLWDIQIFGVTGDNAGNLWLSTGNGLWRYAPDTNEAIHFQAEDGLLSDHFSLFTNIKSKDGKIWLGTNKGLVVFHPDSIRPYPFGPQIQIKQIKVNHEVYQSEDYIGEVETLSFKYYENTYELEIVGVTNYLPHLNHIYYRLEGYINEWQKVKNGDPILLVNVPSGKHTLTIYAQNANGIKGPSKKLEINIAPPFWETIWFWSIITFMAVLIARIVFRQALRRKLKKQKIEFEHTQEKQRLAFQHEQEKKELEFKRQQEMKEALQNERNRIASDMHDDMGGELNTIQILLKGIRKEPLPDSILKNLNKVEIYTAKSIENMREIIWAMNSSYDELPKLIAYTKRFLLEFFENHEIICKTSTTDELPNIIISGEKRRNIFLCIKESANNIVKHSNSTQVSVIFSAKKELKIIIRDNGTGFDFGKKVNTGNGLINMRDRMSKIGGGIKFEREQGTKVILSIPLVMNDFPIN